MAMNFRGPRSRRELLGLAGGLATVGLALGEWPWRSVTRAAAGAAPKRFVTINLVGGWCSILGTDPVIGSKVSSNSYNEAYRAPTNDLLPKTLTAKPSLSVGPGLVTAESAFAAMPTAFVNGVYMQVPGHEFALQYMASGRLTLSSSRDFPSIAALLGAEQKTFPSHVVIGAGVPLGETLYSSPPLQAATVDTFQQMIGGPSGYLFEEDLAADADALIEGLDAETYMKLPKEHQLDLKSWRSASANVRSIYAQKLAGQIGLTPEISNRYEIDRYGGQGVEGPERQLASLLLLLKSNLSPYITIGINGSWDSHYNHLQNHLPYMRRFGTALGRFVEDIMATKDPASPELTLAETTTILITSEFVRTATFNSLGGTEHWSSASAILMGRGVKDGAVIGRTGDDHYALGWNGSSGVPFSETTQILPDHLIATIAANVGNAAMANTISEVRLDGLFT